MTTRGEAELQAIIDGLLEDTFAVGVWLLGRLTIVDNEQFNEVLAGAARDPSTRPPRSVQIEGETYFDFRDQKIFAERIGAVTLVVVFDERSSLGLVALRIRHAREPIKVALANQQPWPAA